MDPQKLRPNYFDQNGNRVVEEGGGPPSDIKFGENSIQIKKEGYLSSFAHGYLKQTIDETKNKFIEELWFKIRQTIYSFISDTLHMFLFQGKESKTKSTNTGGSIMKYWRRSDDSARTISTPNTTIGETVFYEVEVENISDGFEVIDTINEIRSSGYYPRVADLFAILKEKYPDASNIDEMTDHTANYYGWKEVITTKPKRLSNGKYVIRFPKPIILNK